VKAAHDLDGEYHGRPLPATVGGGRFASPPEGSDVDVTAALVELGLALASPEYEADPAGVLAAWAEVVAGEVRLDDRWRLAVEVPAPTREQVVLALARERGAVANGDLREVLGCSGETVRVLLRGLVDAGELVREGDKRAARYRLPGT
jgi:hypothetical protein